MRKQCVSRIVWPNRKGSMSVETKLIAACRTTGFGRASAWKKFRNARPVLLLLIAGALAFGPSTSGGKLLPAHHATANKTLSAKITSRPNSEIRVGDRVWAAQTDSIQDAETQVDADMWKHLILRAEMRWKDGDKNEGRDAYDNLAKCPHWGR